MEKIVRKIILLGLLLGLLSCSLSACGTDLYAGLEEKWPAVVTPEGTEITLRVLTEEDAIDGQINDQLNRLIQKYSKSHENIKIEVEFLPPNYDIEEREAVLRRLRAEIAAGAGPDIFLLPTITYGDDLFRYVEAAMYNGLFHELSAYYDADTELHTEELNQGVMDGGKIGEGRYILPLYYDIPVLMVNEAVLAEHGLTLTDLGSDYSALMDTALNSQDMTVKSCINFCTSPQIEAALTSEFMDFRNGEVLVTQEQVADFMRAYQQWQPVMQQWPVDDEIADIRWADLRNGTRLQPYVTMDYFWNKGEIPFVVQTMEEAFVSTFLSKATDMPQTLVPMAAADGKLTAYVTYWGAVSANCDYADVAYGFLREFLTRESQWEQNRHQDGPDASQSFWTEGFPVRTHGGAAEHLLDSVKKRVNSTVQEQFDTEHKWELLEPTELTDSEFPILEIDEEIQEVHFSSFVDVSLRGKLKKLNGYVADDDPTNDYEPTDVDIDQLAKELVKEINVFIAEG